MDILTENGTAPGQALSCTVFRTMRRRETRTMVLRSSSLVTTSDRSHSCAMNRLPAT